MLQAQTVAYPHLFQGRHPVFDGRSNMYANYDVLSGSPAGQASCIPSFLPPDSGPIHVDGFKTMEYPALRASSGLINQTEESI